MSELQGQIDLNALMGDSEQLKARDMAEGYDAEGHLINPEAEDSEAPTPAAYIEEADRLAVEINAIKEQTRGTVIAAALAIGKRLIAAKALLPQGRWLRWLAENVDYSDRKAQDLMRLYEEYGKKTIPQAIAELDYTKAVALLSLPAEERVALAEQAAEMSTRELQAEVSRLREESRQRQVRIDELLEESSNFGAAIRTEHEAADRARAEAKAAGETAEALKKERDEAQTTRDLEIKKAQNAVTRANDTQKKLTEAEARIRELEAAPPATVEAVPADVAAELERLRSAGQRSEAVLKLRLGYERLLAEFKAVAALLDAVKEGDPEEGNRYAAALAAACERMRDTFKV